MSRALIVFAKEPVSGTVKTRLKSCFSNENLARLYKAFVKDTLAMAKKTRNARKILAFSSVGVPRFLRSISNGFDLIEQKGMTLGKRLLGAFVYAHENKFKKTVIIGTDSPTLTLRMIEKAFTALGRKDVVIGPSVDGGYYLIGMKEPCAGIFKGVRWSSASVLKKTLDNAKFLSKTTVLLDEWYDIDDRAGLERLQRDLTKNKRIGRARYTREVLKNHLFLQAD